LKRSNRLHFKPIPYEIFSRRPSAITASYSFSALAKERLGWEAKHTLKDMVESSWKWQSQNPNGYFE
jgi:UDP-glucose 4-epimerase